MEALNVHRAITAASQANAALCVANITSKKSADIVARSRRRGISSPSIQTTTSVCLSVWLSVFIPVSLREESRICQGEADQGVSDSLQIIRTFLTDAVVKS